MVELFKKEIPKRKYSKPSAGIIISSTLANIMLPMLLKNKKEQNKAKKIKP